MTLQKKVYQGYCEKDGAHEFSIGGSTIAEIFDEFYGTDIIVTIERDES